MLSVVHVCAAVEGGVEEPAKGVANGEATNSLTARTQEPEVRRGAAALACNGHACSGAVVRARQGGMACRAWVRRQQGGSVGVAESDGDDAERDMDVDSGGSLRHGGTEMTDVDKEPDADAETATWIHI